MVDHAPEEQGGEELQDGRAHDDEDEADEHAPVTGGVGQHPTGGACLELGVAETVGVAHRMHHHHRAAGSHGAQPRGAH